MKSGLDRRDGSICLSSDVSSQPHPCFAWLVLDIVLEGFHTCLAVSCVADSLGATVIPTGMSDSHSDTFTLGVADKTDNTNIGELRLHTNMRVGGAGEVGTDMRGAWDLDSFSGTPRMFFETSDLGESAVSCKGIQTSVVGLVPQQRLLKTAFSRTLPYVLNRLE